VTVPLEIHSHHAALGATFGERRGFERVLRYAGPEEETRAAKERVGVTDLSMRQTLRLTGEDRVSFLHGMCTQDVNGLSEGSWAYAALLTAKGAMVADARILRRPGDVLLDVEPGLGAKVLEFLGKYLISEDVELEDASASWGRLALYGPKAREVLQGLVPAWPGTGLWVETKLGGHAVLLLEPSLALPAGGVELWVPPEALGPVFEQLLTAGAPHGLLPVGLEALEVLRVEAGIPVYGQELVDTTIPLEANLERALHYNKGCYIGQEVIARATFRGHMNRKLMGLKLGTALPPLGAELRDGERKVGWVTSVVHSSALGQYIALGYVHRDFFAPGTQLDVPATGGKATVSSLPFSS
jgi:folate-binding protein YgfZ